MNIVFFGTPGFAVQVLDRIYNSKHKVLAVVTAADSEKGRGLKKAFSDVKQYAVDKGIDVLQPERLKDERFIDEIMRIGADLFVVVAFRILPREVFSIPEYGSFNLHASLLPKYRGAAPIQWALINGEEVTGVTTFKLSDKVDTGNIYLQTDVLINEDDNFGTLHDKLATVGKEVVIQTIDLIENEKFVLKEQDNLLATPAPKIRKETCLIDWSKSAKEVNNLIRGLSPYPGAYFINNEKLVKVYKGKIIKDRDLAIGEITSDKKELFIGCSDGAIKIEELQMEGRKRMTAEEFLRGYNLK